MKAIDEDFSVLPELNELEDILQNYPPHNDTVKEHTQKVVAGITRLSFYKHSSGESRAVLKLAAYLHDMGKGPKSNWEKGVMNRAYPDHPADAVPMLGRILTEEVRDISEEEIRQISMLVIYHDLVGDCMKHDRDVEQVLHVIEDENDLEMLCAIAIADAGAINSKWAEEIISEKAQFCEAVLGRKNNEK